MGGVAVRMVLKWELGTRTMAEPEGLLLLGSSEPLE